MDRDREGREARPTRETTTNTVRGDKPVQFEADLLKRLLTSGLDDSAGEIDDYLATGFLNQEELNVVRQQQEILNMYRRVFKLMGFSKEQWLNSQIRERIIYRMETIAQSSKAKGGVGFKAVRTERVVNEENLYDDRGQAENALEQLLSKVSGGDDTRQVVGDQDVGRPEGPQEW